MTIALFSPLNPVKTGISDYTEEMLEELSRHFEIEIYIDPDCKPVNTSLLSQFKVIPFRSDSFDPSRYTAIVYHMGNYYAGHRFIYEALLKFPGIVVLHDYVLQGFYAERYDSTNDFEEYRALQIKHYGDAGEEIAMRIRDRHRLPIWESPEAFRYPLCEEIIERALGVIVHSEFIGSRIRGLTERPIRVIPHHGHVLKQHDCPAIRADLGVEEDEFLLCSAGFINKNKRFHVILAAVDELADLPLKYVIAGTDRGRLLDNVHHADRSRIIRRGHLPIERLEGLIAASDLCINLRYPTMGESSGALLRMMGYGKPVLVTNTGSYAEYPDYSVLKVDPGLDEKEMIKRLIRALVVDPDFRSAVGREASAFVREVCGIAKCAAEYAGFIKDISDTEESTAGKG